MVVIKILFEFGRKQMMTYPKGKNTHRKKACHSDFDRSSFAIRIDSKISFQYFLDFLMHLPIATYCIVYIYICHRECVLLQGVSKGSDNQFKTIAQSIN